ncbi:MAG: hypothetical protein NUV75_00660 [Gallionella sp.]|nr:hypothetical protein [Gallionella sp.]
MTDRVRSLIEGNLWKLLAIGFAGLSGWTTAQVTTNLRLTAIEAKLDNHERQLIARAAFMDCTARSIQRLADKSGQNDISMPCAMDVPR